MSNNAKLDDELAAFTDDLLAGRDTMTVSEELEPLSRVVRQLHAVIPPNAAPAPAVHTHLTQRLIREWNLLHQRPPRLVRFYQRRGVMALAASLLVVILAVVLISLREGGGNEPLEGTALGSQESVIFVVIGGLIIGGLLAFWFKQRTSR